MYALTIHCDICVYGFTSTCVLYLVRILPIGQSAWFGLLANLAMGEYCVRAMQRQGQMQMQMEMDKDAAVAVQAESDATAKAGSGDGAEERSDAEAGGEGEGESGSLYGF